MNLLFYIALFFAIFINTSMGTAMGFANPLIPLLPMMLYLVLSLLTQKMHYNKIAVYLLILAAIILVFKWSIGQNYIIEAGRFLIIPMCMMICFDNMTKKQAATLRYLMIIFFILLCVLAMAEKALNRHFFPISQDIEWISSVGYFRSASLLWHPLGGGFFVAIFMSFISVTDFKKKYLQIFLFFLGYIALFCFDARGATLVTTFVVLPYFLLKLYKMAGKQRWMIIFGVICVLGGLVYLIMETSLGGGRLLNADLLDNSSQTRLDVFNFYKHYKHVDDFIWGHHDNYNYMMEALGAGGVENGIIVMILFYGIIFTPFILLLLFLLQYKSLSVYTKFDKWMLLFVFFGIGCMNTNLAAPLMWQLWIFTYYTFKPGLTTDTQWALRTSLIQ